MGEQTGMIRVDALRKKWTLLELFAHFLMICAFAIIIGVPLVRHLHLTPLILPIGVPILVLLDCLVFFRKLNNEDVAVYLNKAVPEMEESAGLVLVPYPELSFIEQLQVNKIEHAFDQDIGLPPTLSKQLRFSVIMMALALVTSILLYLVPNPQIVKRTRLNAVANRPGTVKPETKHPQIKAARIKISPPGYTGKLSRVQEHFNIVAEEGAAITWNISTSDEVKSVRLLFNDSSVAVLHPVNSEGTRWSISKQVAQPGFYQVMIAGSASALYKIEVIRDRSPDIVVRSPKSSTIIEPGRPRSILVNGIVSDDYGLSGLFLSLTIASGSGEAVTFKDQKLPIPGFIQGKKEHQLQQQIDLAGFGMNSGDELYFYISAKDSKNQERRSDIFTIRLEDTAQLMNIEGMASGVDIQPEFFRSQRQIIIETEQLLKTRDTLSAEAFKNKSNELGIDQKLLRLRYGKFLGEETDVEIGGGHDHDEEEHGDGEVHGDVEEMIEAHMHKHDNAEDATFFDAPTKKQLKATLAEMWKAELQLRTLKPTQALPFEYKALKLLKELQQQTRVYVAKTGSKTTPLKPENRLTGDLEKVMQPVYQQTIKNNSEEVNILRNALGILEQLKSSEPLHRASAEVLGRAAMQLSNRAALEPSQYLPSLEALRRILGGNYQPKDISVAGRGLQNVIAIESMPYPQVTKPDMKLSQRYFRNLNRRND
jgi:hypothetical protein